MFSINHHRFYSEASLAALGAVGSWTMRDVADVVSIVSGVLGSIAATVALGRWVCSWSCWRRGGGANVALFLALLMLVGCDTPGRVVHTTYYPDGKMASKTEAIQASNAKGPGEIEVKHLPTGGVAASGSTGENFNLESIRQAFAAFRPWHFAALACFIVGGLILGTGHLPNRWGWTLLGIGGGLVIVAHVIPAYGAYLAALAGLGALAGAFYLAWQSGYWKPNPALTDEKRKAAQLAFSI